MGPMLGWMPPEQRAVAAFPKGLGLSLGAMTEKPLCLQQRAPHLACLPLSAVCPCLLEQRRQALQQRLKQVQWCWLRSHQHDRHLVHGMQASWQMLKCSLPSPHLLGWSQGPALEAQAQALRYCLLTLPLNLLHFAEGWTSPCPPLW